MDLSNKVAIVTGSTSGIGEAIAIKLARLGASVVINSARSVEAGEALAKKLNKASYCQGSLASEEDMQALVSHALEKHGRLDILVNNAGQLVPNGSADPLDISSEVFQSNLNINVVGTWNLIRQALPHLKQSGEGNIITISASSSIDPAQAVSGVAYAVAKAALNHLTRFIAKQAGPTVRANAIAPGLIATPRAKQFPDVISAYEAVNPLERAGDPEEIASLAVALLQSTLVNGQTIVSDGGHALV